jgi:hypothetical protein
MNTVQVVILILLVLVIAVGGWFGYRHYRLRQRFGPEYDKVAADRSGVGAADRELRQRERRHSELQLKPLNENDQRRYAEEWRSVQAQFVADPAGAVVAGDELVTRLVAQRGYPTKDYEEQLSLLSVEHARTLSHYRDAHEIYLRGQRGAADTEELRQALVHYREIFADLLGTDPAPVENVETEESADV